MSEVPSAQVGRVLTTTPWEIACIVNNGINFGSKIDILENGMVSKMLRQTIFRAVREAIVEHSRPDADGQTEAKDGA